jgi:hypothetical protein
MMEADSDEEIEAAIGTHHPWNAQIHNALEPIAGKLPAYYTVLHRKQDMTAAAAYGGNVAETYDAYHAFAGVGQALRVPGVVRNARVACQNETPEAEVQLYGKDVRFTNVQAAIGAPRSDLVPLAAPADAPRPELVPLSAADAPRPKLVPLAAPADAPRPKLVPLAAPADAPRPKLVPLAAPVDAPRPKLVPLAAPADAPRPKLVPLAAADAPRPKLVPLAAADAPRPKLVPLAAPADAPRPKLVPAERRAPVERAADSDSEEPVGNPMDALPDVDDVFK